MVKNLLIGIIIMIELLTWCVKLIAVHVDSLDIQLRKPKMHM